MMMNGSLCHGLLKTLKLSYKLFAHFEMYTVNGSLMLSGNRMKREESSKGYRLPYKIYDIYPRREKEKVGLGDENKTVIQRVVIFVNVGPRKPGGKKNYMDISFFFSRC